jgi:hypothetical protein
LKKLIKTITGAAAVLALTATSASARTCILWFCWGPPSGGGGNGGGGNGGGGGGGGNGGPPSTPEIDVTQGIAAVAILACVILILREAYLRQRQA